MTDEILLTSKITPPVDIYMPMRNLYIFPGTSKSPILHSDDEYYLEFEPQIEGIREPLKK